MTNITEVSVVIATLGGGLLQQTLMYLNKSSIRPREILICIPEPEVNNLDFELPDNARLIKAPKRGQVAQRAYALGMVNCEFVMQIDDDIMLQPDGIELLIDSIENAGARSAVAPLIKNCSSGAYLTQYRNDLKGIFRSLVATLIGGAPWGSKRMGCIDKSGMPYAIDKAYCDEEKLVSVEWLPGGCVLARRADLILEDYFPFQGKAYSEDVIHSLLWRKNGVRLWIAPDVAVCTYVSASALTSKSIRADYEARKYVVSMMGGSFLRCWLWYQWIAFREKARALLR